MKAAKENKVYTIHAQEAAAYAAQGFDITDDSGRILRHAAGKTVPYEQYAALQEENRRLRNQLAGANAGGSAAKQKLPGGKRK